MTSASPTDPFLFDIEQLHALADPVEVREGVRGFKENRVMDVGPAGDFLFATVEDEGFSEPLSLEVRYDEECNLFAPCGCGGAGDGRLCRHAVAALIAYGARTGAPVELTGAAEAAIEERIQRARSEVRVEPVEGEPWYGAWRAQSVGNRHFQRGYRVHIRSLKKRANFCTCPDFATNQLGTCKHIEAVLHTIRKRPDFPRIEKQPPPLPFVYLDWEAERPPLIRLHRTAGMERNLAGVLDDHFDAAGAYIRRVPEDFLRLADLLRDRADIDLGEDALGHARELAERAAHQLRAAEIGERIRSSGGRLAGVQARLYPYQMEGVAFLAAGGRALLADDMGLGKTLQAIAAASWLRAHEGAERVLVVCPASLKHQWAREIERFTGQPVTLVQGNAEARTALYRRGGGFYVLNYELIPRDLSVINETLRPDLLILDEAQRIKNWRTKLASAVKLVPTRYAFVLSGTPLENRLEDLYSLMQVVDSRVLGPLWRYLVDFHVTDDRGKVLGYRNLSELRRRLAPVMLRRDRRLVADQLPARIEQRIDTPMTPRQLELHDAAIANAGRIAQIAKRRPLTPSEQNRLLAALQNARMACDAAGLVDKETEGAPKLDELESLLEQLCIQSGLKVVVFSQWERMTEMAERRVRGLGLGCVRLHGGVPTASRGGLMDRFRDDPGIQVFISTDAGATGLNLQTASALVNLDIPWNPAILDQRIARIHRLGQRNTVQIMLLVAADSYEEQVLGLVQNKRELFTNVVEPDATEDVVGVSKKLIEVLVEQLGEEPGPTPPRPAAEEVPPPEPAAAAEPREIKPKEESPLEAELRRVILELQAAFSTRIERILGKGGGLVAVLERVEEADEQRVAGLSADIPVALIDLRTLRSLNRLGGDSPLAEATPHFAAPEPSTPAEPAEPPLLRQAREKLKGAGLLLEQHCTGPAQELLLGALLGAAAHRAGEAAPPSPQQAGVWLYSAAIPKGVVSAEQAGLIMRAIALAQAGDAVPESLVGEVLQEAEQFLAS